MDDEFATSAIAALSTFNYYHDSPCRTYLMQALKSSCTVFSSSLNTKQLENPFLTSIFRFFDCTRRVYFELFFVVIQMVLVNGVSIY